MSVERILKYDEATKILKVSATTTDSFSLEQVKNILTDLEAKLLQLSANLKKLESTDFALKSMAKDSRMKDIVETVLVFVPQADIPNPDGIAKAIKNFKEQKEILEKDIAQLRPIAYPEKK